MKHSLSIFLFLPMFAMIVLVASFSYSYPQTKPMLVFRAPASADATKNPLKGDAASAQTGQKLYIQQCGPCHGDKGRGDGPAASGLSKAPANHTSDQVQGLTDGALYWMITTGNIPMPSYAALSATQRWQLVDFIRTLARKH
jgi:mono/diheme cytochrome c family protein